MNAAARHELRKAIYAVLRAPLNGLIGRGG